jgi:hypothetical protein
MDDVRACDFIGMREYDVEYWNVRVVFKDGEFLHSENHEEQMDLDRLNIEVINGIVKNAWFG